MAKIRVTIELQRDGEGTVHRMGFGCATVEPTSEGLKSFLLNEVDDHILDLVDRFEGRPTRWVFPDGGEDIFEELEPDESWKRMFGQEGPPLPNPGETEGSIHEDGLDIDFGGRMPVQGDGTIDGMPCYYRARNGWVEFSVYPDEKSCENLDKKDAYFLWGDARGTSWDPPGTTKQNLWEAVGDLRKFKERDVFLEAVKLAKVLEELETEERFRELHRAGIHPYNSASFVEARHNLMTAVRRLAPQQRCDEEDG